MWLFLEQKVLLSSEYECGIISICKEIFLLECCTSDHVCIVKTFLDMPMISLKMPVKWDSEEMIVLEFQGNEMHALSGRLIWKYISLECQGKKCLHYQCIFLRCQWFSKDANNMLFWWDNVAEISRRRRRIGRWRHCMKQRIEYVRSFLPKIYFHGIQKKWTCMHWQCFFLICQWFH